MQDLSRILADIRKGLDGNAYKTSANVRNHIVLRILGAVGWNISDRSSIRHNYSLRYGSSTRGVDLALCVDGRPRCIIESKSIGIGIDRNGITDVDIQLFQHAVHAGVPIAVVTNGRDWSFYSLFSLGSYYDRTVGRWSVDGTAHNLIAPLVRYLSYENTHNGRAGEFIRSDVTTALLRQTANTLIPKAWEHLLQGTHSKVVKLLVSETTSLAGITPSEAEVREFLENLVILDPLEPVLPTSGIHFHLLGKEYEKKNALRAYVHIFRHLGRRDPRFFEKAAKRLVGTTRKQLARTVEELGLPPSVRNGYERLTPEWFIITHLSNANKMQFLRVACEIADIPFDDPAGLRISIPTVKRRKNEGSTVGKSQKVS